MVLLLVACAEDPPETRPDEDVDFAGRYTFQLAETETPTESLAWFEGEVVISGPSAAVVFDFGEVAYEGTGDDAHFAFAGPSPDGSPGPADAEGNVYSRALTGTIAFATGADPVAFAFDAELIEE
jgi:hypothetical protein